MQTLRRIWQVFAYRKLIAWASKFQVYTWLVHRAHQAAATTGQSSFDILPYHFYQGHFDPLFSDLDFFRFSVSKSKIWGVTKSIISGLKYSSAWL